MSDVLYADLGFGMANLWKSFVMYDVVDDEVYFVMDGVQYYEMIFVMDDGMGGILVITGFFHLKIIK